jgi:adenylate kinase
MSPSYSSLNLVLLGPPGSGKSTQARRVAASYNLPHISTSDMLKEEMELETAVGIAARAHVQRGELVPDRLLAGLMLHRLDRDDCARGFILDGYPRTVDQAMLLDGILAELGRSIERVVLIDLPLEIGARRLNSATPGDSGGGSDALLSEDVVLLENAANEQVTGERLGVWRENAPSLLDFYRDRSLLLEVDGDQTVDEVEDAVLRAVGEPVGA